MPIKNLAGVVLGIREGLGLLQPLIHKASINLASSSIPRQVAPGDIAKLHLNDDETIAVILTISSRWPFGWGKAKEWVAGVLGAQASDILRPALRKGARLRVRIVELEPAHLSADNQSRLYISVWGDPGVLTAEQPKFQIFSRSKINDDPKAS